MEARIRQLASMIENAEIVEGTDGDVVEPGAVVELRYEGDSDDEVEIYFYGSVEEQGVEHDIITPGSPLGEALAGAKVGDQVSFQSPAGATLTVEVVSIT
jgi:transcription elongation factor GreA